MIKSTTMTGEPPEAPVTPPDNEDDLTTVYDDVLGEYGLAPLQLSDTYAKRALEEGEVSNHMEGVDIYNGLSLEGKIDFARRLGEERREALRIANEMSQEDE